MSLHVHQLDINRHTRFLEEGRQDPVTKETLKTGNHIVICAGCKTAYLADSWDYVSRECLCGTTNTLNHVPCPEESLDITQSSPRISPAVRKRRNKYIGLGVGLSILILIIVANITNNKDKRNTKIAKEYTTGKSSSDLREVLSTWYGNVNNKPATFIYYREGNQLAGKMIYDGVEEFLNVTSYKKKKSPMAILKGTFYKRLDGTNKSFSLHTFYVTSINKNNSYMEGHFEDSRGNKGKWSVHKKMDSFAKTAISPPGTITTGRLGISAKNLSPALAKSLNTNITEGVIVEDIQNGSFAQEAGFECNDILITFDEKPVSNVEQLKELVDQTELGKLVKVVVLRNGSEKTLAFTMGEQTVNTNETVQEISSDTLVTEANLQEAFSNQNISEQPSYNRIIEEKPVKISKSRETIHYSKSYSFGRKDKDDEKREEKNTKVESKKSKYTKKGNKSDKKKKTKKKKTKTKKKK